LDEISIIEINRRIKSEIESKLKDIQKRPRDYINDIVVLINREIGINKILSIILFGSQRTVHEMENTAVSDCDLLIIFKDRVSNRHIREIEKYFIALEIKHNFRELDDKFTKKLLAVLQSSTGIFISHFLTKRKYFEAATFHKIFGVNKFFSRFFAPRTIVLASVIDNSSILYGEDLRDIVKKKIKIPTFDMVKSATMNLIISLFSIAILPFRSLKSVKYQLEAIKWALRASNYYSFEDSISLEKITDRFSTYVNPEKVRNAKDFFKEFIELRKNPKKDIYFMLKSPVRIIKIHLKGILFKKILRKISTTNTFELKK
jgi:hypothetical protein